MSLPLFLSLSMGLFYPRHFTKAPLEWEVIILDTKGAPAI